MKQKQEAYWSGSFHWRSSSVWAGSSGIEALQLRKDVTPNLAAVVGGHIDIIDITALILIPILFFFGMRTVRVATMESRSLWGGSR